MHGFPGSMYTTYSPVLFGASGGECQMSWEEGLMGSWVFMASRVRVRGQEGHFTLGISGIAILYTYICGVCLPDTEG